ncbi:MAG: ligase-associated DNA damage response endonuclease PdeM [Bacteroidia bacterium]|jgi:DNA ligase-associated metallophosphoesterase|nr:ligase-associated DNA damage response endonuclease PdeM [Bacteroidia bacterium]
MSVSVLPAGEELLLLPEKAAFRPALKQLLVADLHLGKATHFRKSGIAVPHAPHTNTLQRLQQLAEMYDAESIAVLGDFFHSDRNAEWDYFSGWMDELGIPVFLITGNHDRQLLRSDIPDVFCGDELVSAPFVYQHHPEETADNRGYYRIAGHVHPGYLLRGKARQRVSLPCFHLQPNQLILPAFGDFTGKEIISPLQGDRVFVVAGNVVSEVPGE